MVDAGNIGQRFWRFVRPSAANAESASGVIPGALWVLILSGLCGAFMGTLPRLQSAVESAQVLAGLVQYPPDNPFYLYHIKSWTLLHQVPAFVLQLGVSERAVSVILGALFGMMSFQALALCCYAIGRNTIVALALPFVAVASGLYEEVSNVYPIFLLTEKPWNCYGICGTSLALLAWALHACGWRKTSLFLMGMAPAVHPTMGGWCLLFGMPMAVWQAWHARTGLRSSLMALGAGLLVAAASYGLHLQHARLVPSIDAELRTKYVTAFMEGWDTHRQPVPLHEPVVLYGVACLALCGLALWTHRGDRSRQYLQWTLLASAAASLILVFATHFPNLLPTMVVMAMPGRFINVVCVALPALLAGTLVSHPADFRRHVVLVFLMGFSLLRGLRHEWEIGIPQVWHAIALCTLFVLAVRGEEPEPSGKSWLPRAARLAAVAGLLIFLGWEAWRNPVVACIFAALLAITYLPGRLKLSVVQTWPLRITNLVAAAIGVATVAWCTDWITALSLAGLHVAVMAATADKDAWLGRVLPQLRVAPLRLALVGAMSILCLATFAKMSYGRAEIAMTKITDWQSHSVYRAAHQGRGLLLTSSSLRGIQLKTARPVLLEGAALNQLPYVPESGPKMNYILQKVHGEDLFAPRPEGWKLERGGLMDDSGKTVWEQRTPAEWQALADEFQFTQVLAFTKWNVQLPVIARTNRVTLYALPGGEPVSTASLPPASEPRIANNRKRESRTKAP